MRNTYRIAASMIFYATLGIFIATLVHCLEYVEGVPESGDSVSGSSISTMEAEVVEYESETKDVNEEGASENTEEEIVKSDGEVTGEVEGSEVPESDTSAVPYGESIDDYSEEEQELLLNAVGIDVFDSILGTIRLEGDDIIRVESTSESLASYVGPIEWFGDNEFTYGSGEGKVKGFYDPEEDSMVINNTYFRRRR